MSSSNVAAKRVAGGESSSNSLITKLGILLVFQIVLAIGLKMTESTYQTVEATAALVPIDFAKVNKIVIEQNAGVKNKVTLQKDGAAWVMPDYHKARASQISVNQLTEVLKNLKKGLPVATTNGAVERFKLKPDNSVRTISLYQEGSTDPSVLYLGTSPGFKSIYAKTAKSNEIYTIPLAEYQVLATPADYLDRSIAFFSAPEITGLEVNNLKLQLNSSNKWEVTSDGKTQPVRSLNALPFVNQFGEISINSIKGEKELPSFDSEHPELTYKIKLKNREVTVKIAKLKNSNSEYVLKRDDGDLFCGVDEPTVRRLRGMSIDSLIAKDEGKKNGEQPQKGDAPTAITPTIKPAEPSAKSASDSAKKSDH